MQASQSTFRSEVHHVIPAVKLFIFQRPTQHQQSAQIPHHLNTQIDTTPTPRKSTTPQSVFANRVRNFSPRPTKPLRNLPDPLQTNAPKKPRRCNGCSISTASGHARANHAHTPNIGTRRNKGRIKKKGSQVWVLTLFTGARRAGSIILYGALPLPLKMPLSAASTAATE